MENQEDNLVAQKHLGGSKYFVIIIFISQAKWGKCQITWINLTYIFHMIFNI